MPIIHAVPSLHPLVPSPDSVIKEAGLVCFFSASSRMKTMTNPETDRNSVACVILGTDLGDRNKGPAILAVSRVPRLNERKTWRGLPVINIVTR